MYQHATSVEFILRGETGRDLDLIKQDLAALPVGATRTYQQYEMLGGREIPVKRISATYFEIDGHTRL